MSLYVGYGVLSEHPNNTAYLSTRSRFRRSGRLGVRIAKIQSSTSAPSHWSISPSLVSEWRGIQLLSIQPPAWEVLVQDCGESPVMTPFDKMRDFVHDDVFQALHGFLSEFEVQPDALGLGIAGTPL